LLFLFNGNPAVVSRKNCTFAGSKNIKQVMGRGDKKTKKGKTFKGSFGNSRPARPAKKKAEGKKEGS
jgi:30S ribosomal protein S31